MESNGRNRGGGGGGGGRVVSQELKLIHWRLMVIEVFLKVNSTMTCTLQCEHLGIVVTGPFPHDCS